MKSVLTGNQKKEYKALGVMLDDQKVDVIATVRYDDECKNGHNSFAITASIYEAGKRGDRSYIMGGCCHDEIAATIPELAPYIKWHLCNSDMPMYYYANTMYHARDRAHEGKEIGEVVAFDTKLKFVNSPFTFREQECGFWAYLDEAGDFNSIEVEAIKYDGADKYDFSDNYSLTGFIKENELKKWYKAPFKNKEDAEEFLKALQSGAYEFVKIPTKWCEAVIPNLEAARSCAIWQDATLEQLQSREALEARLPALMEEFKTAVESLGFTY